MCVLNSEVWSFLNEINLFGSTFHRILPDSISFAQYPKFIFFHVYLAKLENKVTSKTLEKVLKNDIVIELFIYALNW